MTRRLPARPRKVLRAVHVLASAAWLGLVTTMLVVGLAAATTDSAASADFAYRIMDRVGGVFVPVLAVASVLTGVVLSVATPWGLLRHRWIVVKIVLSAVTISTGVVLTGRWVDDASHGADSAPWLLVAGATAHLVMLGAATVISVDKPWGRLRRARARTRTPAREPRVPVGV